MAWDPEKNIGMIHSNNRIIEMDVRQKNSLEVEGLHYCIELNMHDTLPLSYSEEDKNVVLNNRENMTSKYYKAWILKIV